MSACEHKNPLQREGSSQNGRNRRALDPAFVQLDDRTPDDLVHFADHLARLLNFPLYEESSSDWSKFLETIRNIPESEWTRAADRPPHLTLFLTFLKLFRHSQAHLNDLPRRHLDLFYQTLLGLKTRPAEPDHVHVLFELNRRFSDYKIDKGTRLAAGKDPAGQPLYFETENDLIVNQAKINQLRSVFLDQDRLKYALAANTADGWGEPFENPDTQWPAFGSPALPEAQTGIALASPVLLLKEGDRWVTLRFRLSGFSEVLTRLDENTLLNNLEIFGSGEKGWIGPFREIRSLDEQTPVLKPLGNGYELVFRFRIPTGEKALVAYRESVFRERFNTYSPLVKIFFRHPLRRYLDALRLDSVKIAVSVRGMTNLNLRNQLGTLDPSQSFQPFGPIPKTGSCFYVGSDEVFSKNYTDLKLHIRWHGLPKEGLEKHYEHYKGRNAVNTDFKAELSVSGKGDWQPLVREVQLFPPVGQENEVWTLPPRTFRVTPNLSAYVVDTASFRIMNNKPLAQVIHTASPTLNPINTSIRVEDARVALPALNFYSELIQQGFIRLRLSGDFGHKAYYRQLAEIEAHNLNPNNTVKQPKPSEPYVPEIDSLKLDYSAETGDIPLNPVGTELRTAYTNRQIQFFHLEPFGHREQHAYLKEHLTFLSTRDTTFLPVFREAGEFYVGIENASPAQSLNILIQLAEGSADPDTPNLPVRWSVLCQNHWYPLTQEHLLADGTENFLRSGILSIQLPRDVNTDNTLLDPGFVWLKASLRANVKGVCEVINMHTQAVRARRVMTNPSLAGLPLPPFTIKKLEQEASPVKKIEQPYASFGGRVAETPAQFYIRTSERLRHKNRAVSVWDYEHLVLEKFPAVYKVRCLNHTGMHGDFAPGKVTLVLIPNLRNKHAHDPLRPRFSRSFLREVEEYLQGYSPAFVEISAVNALFEEVQLTATVKFRRGFESGYYLAQLNQDLVRFLTPWAFEEGRELLFNGELQLSQIIAFAEKREYVDHLENFSLHRLLPNGRRGPAQNAISPESPRSVLVSAPSHRITSL